MYFIFCVLSLHILCSFLKIETLPLLWASLVAQMVTCLPAMRETRVRFLGWEDPLEMEMAVHSITLAWNFAGTLSVKEISFCL